MTYDEAKKLIGELLERYDNPYSPKDKNTIETLHFDVLGKEFIPTTCQNCYHDAVIIIYNYLKTHKTMAEKCNYRLRAGFIIHCPNFHNGQIYTNDSLTNEIAAEYLEKYPDNVDMFQELPDPTTEDAPQEDATDGEDVDTDGEGNEDENNAADDEKKSNADNNTKSEKKAANGKKSSK